MSTTLEYPKNESKRIEALRRYNILDTPPDGSFDRITALAATLFKVPIAIISLVDTDRIWFKSHYGLSINQINRDPGLCASAILSDDVYVVENAAADPRTLANPLVAGDFGLRFYAATPLHTDESYNLGTLCLLDKEPRVFTEEERKILQQLGEIVMDEMENRLLLRSTVERISKVAHDITSNLEATRRNIEATGELDKSQILSYLEATGMFMSSIKNQLRQL